MKNKRTKKQLTIIIILIIAAYLVCFGIIAIFACMFLGVFPTPKSVRQSMLNEYSADKTYSVIVGQARINYYNENEFFITVTLNEVTTDNYGNYKIGNEYEYGFTSSQRKIIADNGFKEILSDPLTNNYGWTYYDLTQPVTLTVNESIWWDGMRPFAVGLSVGDKEFLSFETGKAKLLHYIEHEMQ